MSHFWSRRSRLPSQRTFACTGIGVPVCLWMVERFHQVTITTHRAIKALTAMLSRRGGATRSIFQSENRDQNQPGRTPTQAKAQIQGKKPSSIKKKKPI